MLGAAAAEAVAAGCQHRGHWVMVGQGLLQGVPAAPRTEPPEPGPGCAGAAGVVQELLGTEAFPAFSRCELWGELVGFSCIF